MSILPYILIITIISSQLEARYVHYKRKPYIHKHNGAISMYPKIKRGGFDYLWYPEKRMPTPLVKDLDHVLDSYMEEGNTVAQDIIGNLRSLLTEVNHAGAMISRAAKVYSDEVPENGIAGLLSDPDDPKRLLRIS